MSISYYFRPERRRLAAFLLATALGLNCLHAQPQIVMWPTNSSVSNIPTAFTDIKAISAAGAHCLILRSNGLVVAWGNNFYGQTNVPVTVSNVMAIAAGGDDIYTDGYNLVLRSNGTVTAWGTSAATNIPAGLSGVTAIAAGTSHALALKSNGTVIAWGDNSSGQTNVPAGLTGVAAIAAGDIHSLALKSNGTVVAWGDNNSGQINVPAGLSNVMAIAAGYHHNLVLFSNGTVGAWELNVYGETSVPTGLSNVVAIAAGYFYSMALKNDGTVVAWGIDFNGETNVPSGLTNVTAISTPCASSGDYSIALTPSPVCPPGFPDNFECRASISGSNISFSTSNVGATSEPGEPEHFGFLDAGTSLWYNWTAPFSGGAAVVINTSYANPCLAVYTGNSLATLASVASNATAFSQSRLVFSAQSGTNYKIVLDGLNFGGTNQNSGNINFNLALAPPPVNDLFASRTTISNSYLETSGSFIGATSEPGEPAHTNVNGIAGFQQTLWWTWTAPTNLGVSAIPVKLIASGVSFPPNIGVYTGTVVASLANVALTTQSNGMTRMTSFTATAGTTYQIALGGQQYDSTGVNSSARYGNYYFRMNIRALVMGFANLSSTVNGDNSINFGADLQVTNFGSASSSALRAQITTISGVSVLGQDTGYSVSNQNILLTTNLSALNPAQTVTKHITGLAPAPTVSPGSSPTNGIGYGVYAELQEQVDTNWFSVDQTLVLFSTWPDLNGNAGPGGGVIRLDPNLTGAGFNPLSKVNILGPLSILEGSSTLYTGLATYASGYQYSFTNTTWTSTLFTITNGLYTAGSVTSNSPATLDAKFSSSGFNYDSTTNILIVNLPPPKMAQVKITTNRNISFQLQGVSNRNHVIEATSVLQNPSIWVPLGTNSMTNGVWNFSESITNHSQRFYRAREQ